MSKKKIILLSITIIVIMITSIIMFKVITKDHNKKNNNDIKSNINETDFLKEYKVKNEKYNQKANEFNYSADIYSSDGRKELTCLSITFYDKEKNVILSYNENVYLTVDDSNSYKVSVNYPNNLAFDTVEYNLCDES